jgi:hypothetical protein
MPAIVLLNPEDVGSLLRDGPSDIEKAEYAYWQKNAIIYVMGKSKKSDKHDYVLFTLTKINIFLIYLLEI